MIFQIDRCQSDTPGVCAPEEEINKFVSRLKVETWTNYYKTDFTILPSHQIHSVVRIEKYVASDVISLDKVTVNNYNIRKNFLESEDSWFFPDEES